MKFIFIHFCIVLFLMLSSVAGAQTYDTPTIWSTGSRFIWVGNEYPDPEHLSVTINGNRVLPPSLTINNYDGAVHIKIGLAKGKINLISIQNGDDILLKADLFYSPSYESALVPEEYERKTFHMEEREAECVKCHRLNPQETDMLQGNIQENICFPCHKNKFSERTFQHKKEGENLPCLRCHQTEAVETDYSFYGPVKFAIKEGTRVANLCYQCHEEKKNEFSQYRYLHGPIAMGMCNMCHNPHGSDFKHLLQKETSSVCIECHEMQELLKKPNTHKPVVKEGCTFCHNPHGSKFPLLLASEVKVLCLGCHPKTEEQKNNHPVTGHPVSAPHDPKNLDRPFSCVSCHNPHASDFDKMLPVEEVMMLCIICHPNSLNY